jgi:hypothetical protein
MTCGWKKKRKIVRPNAGKVERVRGNGKTHLVPVLVWEVFGGRAALDSTAWSKGRRALVSHRTSGRYTHGASRTKKTHS